jgi:hypothetical protein
VILQRTPISSGFIVRHETGLIPPAMQYIINLMERLFGCYHKQLSFPLTIKGRRLQAAHETGTYVVCLDCGKEFAYDWSEMRIVSANEPQTAARRPVETSC